MFDFVKGYLNKYTAIIIIFVILFVFYWFMKKRKRSNKTKTKSKQTKSSKKHDNDDLRKDAEELYNLVHEGMCGNMQSDEFDELTGDLADTSTFIELKQIYNQCKEKGLNPEKTITVEKYIEILKN